MKLLGVAPALTVFTFVYTLFTLLIAKEAIDISHSIDIAKRFNIKMNEISSYEQNMDKKIKEGIDALKNKTIKTSELSTTIDNIFKKVVNEFSTNDTKVTYVFIIINSTRINNETYGIQVKYKINIEITERDFDIRSEMEGKKDITVNLLEDSVRS